ncbi:hypothetical protein R84B8_01277 [Treponema sp. R8-4-B8]
MANLKWGSISAICALSVSILLGMVAGVGIVHIILRALIFTVVFFGIGFGLRFVLDSFFPEVLAANEEAVSPESVDADGHESITIDSMGEYAVPELFNQHGNPEELGNVEDLISGAFKPRTVQDDFNLGGNQSEYQNFDYSGAGEGIDRKKEAGYNNLGGDQDDSFLESAAGDSDFSETAGFDKTDASKPAAFQPQFTPSFGDDSGLGGLPDLDMMAMAFSSNYSGTPAPSAPSAASAPAVRPVEDEPDRSQYKGNKPQTLEGNYDPKSLAQGIRTVLSKS